MLIPQKHFWTQSTSDSDENAMMVKMFLLIGNSFVTEKPE